MNREEGPEVHCAFDEMVAVETLVPHPRNPNTHPQRQVELLVKIIREQGWRAPITVSNRSGFVVRGHGRLLAAEALGLKEVPIDRQDYLTDASELADLIADNRIAELSVIDDELLVGLIGDLGDAEIDMELTGFDVDGIGTMIEKEQSEKKSQRATGPLYTPKFAVIIDCENEESQTRLIERFIKENLSCRALML